MALRASAAARAVLSATRVCADGNPNAAPNMVKWWKTYAYTRNQRVQQLSPFEVDVMGPLFRDMGGKLRHKVEDNFWDVAPPLLFFAGLVYYVKWKRQDILLHHRD